MNNEEKPREDEDDNLLRGSEVAVRRQRVKLNARQSKISKQH